jgi:NAD(P)-dependent dehydrogenase (short-subunit alcohol dehydrogenase family)
VLLEAAMASRPRPRYVAPLAAAAQLLAARVVPRGLFDAALRGAMGLPSASRGAPHGGTELALITGAAGGIGSNAALRLAKRGFRVIATDRDEAALTKLARAGKEARLAIEVCAMDVTDPASIARAAGLVERRSEGRGLDVLVNNAGYAELGPIELASDEAWRAQLEVNVYGLVAVTQAFAPDMRRARRGHIVNVSSIAGLLAFPFMGVYCASKFAVEALTDALRLELGAFGVGVSAVQPSFIRSGFAARATQTVERYRLKESPYAPIADRMDAILSRMDALGGEPEDVARAIERAATSASPRPRYRAPFSAKVAAAALPWVPSALEDRGLTRMFELHRLRA